MYVVAFDFDGTLSDDEMLVALAEQRGPEAANEVAEMTERAMNDELGYAESLRRRAALLEHLEVEAVEAAWEGLSLRPGAGALLARLAEYGHHVAVVTGGFEDGVAAALESAGVADAVEEVVANRLVARGGRLTGEVTGPLVDGTKDRALESLAADRHVPLSRTAAVGDGANDLPMLEVAGLAVGFRATDPVRSACDVAVSSVERLEGVFEDRGLLDAE
jgi:phosphoserine phosphatase